MKFKNRLGAPESIHMRGFSPKNEQIWPRGLGCRGGATDFGGFSPCISITSVLEIAAGVVPDRELYEIILHFAQAGNDIRSWGAPF